MGLPREVMLAQMPSHELTGFLALFTVRHEEDEMRRHRLESGDGQVIVTGQDDDEFDDEDDDGDGPETE